MLFSLACVLCGAPAEPGAESFCRACREDLPQFPAESCPGCGAPSERAALCLHCCASPPAYDACIAACGYHYPVDLMVKKLKYQARLDLARALSAPLLERLKPAPGPRPDCLIPTPLHRARQRRRGFNQAREIARILARNLAVPVDDGLLRRHKPTAQQYELRPEQRARNVKGAFSLMKTMSYKNVAVIDDILTTGATAHEMARLLKDHGAEHVQVWCLARAAPPGQ